MALDRTGGIGAHHSARAGSNVWLTPEHTISDRCPYDCRRGWLSEPDADVMRACPIHRPRPIQPSGSTGHISARAAEAIARAEREDHHA